MSLLLGGAGTANPPTLTKDKLLALIDHLAAAAGTLNGLSLGLYKDGPLPGVLNTFASFTECDFSGYAAIAMLTWGPASWEEDVGEVVSLSPDGIFTHSGGAVANTVKGIVIFDPGAPNDLVYSDEFLVPKMMQFIGDQIEYVPRVKFKPEM